MITKIENNTVIAYVKGELDHHLASKIRDEVDEKLSSKIKNIIFDFSELDFMDSSGVGMIMGRYKKVGAFGGRVIITAPKPQVKRIIKISGLSNIVKTEHDIKHALKRL